MREIKLVPYGFPCPLSECPAGPFLYDGTICFVSKYLDPYILECGTAFWGGTSKKEDRGNLVVQPLILEIEE